MGWWDDDEEEREPFKREQGESVGDCQGRASAELAREPRSEVKEAWEDCEDPPAEPDPVEPASESAIDVPDANVEV